MVLAGVSLMRVSLNPRLHPQPAMFRHSRRDKRGPGRDGPPDRLYFKTVGQLRVTGLAKGVNGCMPPGCVDDDGSPT
jgi:hypothetical protein